MQHHRLLPSLLPLLVLAACSEQELPTAPAEPGGPAFSHTAGHKVVNSVADPGDGACNATQCTLREAIKDPGSTEISFAPGLTGSITLARSGLGGGMLVIEKTLTITGPSTGIVIRRRSTDPAFRIFRIGTGVTVTLTNLTIRNGKTDRNGGGISNFGTLALTNCTVAGNASSQHGGGIDNHGPLTLTHTTVVANSAGRGGGMANSQPNGTVTLTNSTVARNSAGGGIFTHGGSLGITNSVVSFNSGPGISQIGASTSTLDRVRILGNSNGGIRLSSGRMTLTNSTVAGNSAFEGGGIANVAGGITIANSAITNNLARDAGGGISNTVNDPFRRLGAQVTLTNSTVSGNSAPFGGGIANTPRHGTARVRLTNSTVARNSATQHGGGIFQTGAFGEEDQGFLALTNSLVAQNSAPTGPDVFDQIGPVFASFSLIGDGTGSGLTNNGNQVGTASAAIDPKLGPLADNGGPTRTHALLLGSPAIDAASTPDCPPTDQRGVLRPQGAACDIGSYERK
jgi:CSLREA domain-containing protein